VEAQVFVTDVAQVAAWARHNARFGTPDELFLPPTAPAATRCGMIVQGQVVYGLPKNAVSSQLVNESRRMQLVRLLALLAQTEVLILGVANAVTFYKLPVVASHKSPISSCRTRSAAVLRAPHTKPLCVVVGSLPCLVYVHGKPQRYILS